MNMSDFFVIIIFFIPPAIVIYFGVTSLVKELKADEPPATAGTRYSTWGAGADFVFLLIIPSFFISKEFGIFMIIVYILLIIRLEHLKNK